jgi:hypothetical protein
MRVGSDLVVLDDVPQGACPTCGSRVYKATILAAIEGLMRSAPRPAERTPSEGPRPLQS